MHKLKSYVILLALVASMASCVDIQEPMGIQDIRSAKIEFLKAQTSLQLAEAKLIEAKAATEMSNAKLMEVNVKTKLLQNSADSSRNLQDKARFELEMKVLQAQSQTTLLEIQTQVANAQRIYQQALADLAIAKTVEIPQMYMDKLAQIKDELSSTMYQITNIENQIIDRNLKLSLWGAKDSLNLDYTLRAAIVNRTKELLLAQDALKIANLLKTANQAELDKQKADVMAKRQALVNEKSVEDAKINNLNAELTDLTSQNNKFIYQLNTKSDYSFTLAIPQKIRKKVYAQFAYSNYLFKADTSSIGSTAGLNSILYLSHSIMTYAAGQKSAYPAIQEWNTFLTAATAINSGFVNTQKQLMGAQNDLLITINYKNAVASSLNSNLARINNSISSYDYLLNTINSNLSGLDDIILNAQNRVNNVQGYLAGANADLAAWLKGYTNDGWGNYASVKDRYLREITNYQNQLKDLKVRFDALTKQKDDLVKLINDYKL